jgi:Uma2 family endonuclease
MTAPPTRSTDWLQAGAALVPLTVDQYHEMMRRGIIPESAQTEVIDGFLVLKDRSKRGGDPMVISSEHRWAVEKLRDLDNRVRGWNMHVAAQQPVALGPMHEPEPDASIVNGSLDDYRARTPTARDVLCACEVADSSLRYDRTTKQRLYATAGIPRYVIVNLVDRTVELYADPDPATGRYARVQTIQPGQSFDVELGIGRVLTVNANDVLP